MAHVLSAHPASELLAKMANEEKKKRGIYIFSFKRRLGMKNTLKASAKTAWLEKKKMYRQAFIAIHCHTCSSMVRIGGVDGDGDVSRLMQLFQCISKPTAHQDQAFQRVHI